MYALSWRSRWLEHHRSVSCFPRLQEDEWGKRNECSVARVKWGTRGCGLKRRFGISRCSEMASCCRMEYVCVPSYPLCRHSIDSSICLPSSQPLEYLITSRSREAAVCRFGIASERFGFMGSRFMALLLFRRSDGMHHAHFRGYRNGMGRPEESQMA